MSEVDYHSTQSHDQRIAAYLPNARLRFYYWHYRMGGFQPRESVTKAIEDYTDEKPFAQCWGYVRQIVRELPKT